MRRFAKLLVAFLFPVFLLAYPASILLPVERVEIENVALDRPEPALDRLASPTFYRELLSYIRAASPMRTVLIRAGAWLDFSIFDDSPDPTRVLKGTEGWLYFSPTMIRPCLTSPELVARNLVDFIRRLEMDVPTVVVTVAPSKFTIHPEHLTEDQKRLGECARVAGAELRRLLAIAGIDDYVDGWRVFESVRANGSQAYFATDTHFHFEGSIPWMHALIDEIGPVWDPNDVVDLGKTRWLGNLTRLIGLDLPEEVGHLVVQRELETEVIEETPEIDRYLHRGQSELIAGKTLVLADSFMDLPRQSFVQYFSDITIVDWRDETIDYFLQHAADSDTIIVEVSELDVWLRFATSDLLERYESG